MIRQLRAFLRKEFRQALRDTRMRLLLFVAPMIQLTLFGLAISTDVKNVDLWAQPDANDWVLAHIYERSVQGEWFRPAPGDHATNPFERLRAGEADAALVAPPGGVTRALQRGTADLQLLVDATNVLEAQAVEYYVRSIATRVVEDDLHAQRPESPIRFDVRVLFNPTLETAYFMVPGVMVMLLSITTIILTSMSLTREKEAGTFEMLIAAPVRPVEVILGKTIPYLALGLAQVPLILGVAVLGFGVPMRGSLTVVLLASLAFVCSTVAIGTLISTLASNQQQSTMAGFMFLFPAVLLSGLMFPIENMPEVMKWVAYLDPLMYFLALLRNIMLKGGDPGLVTGHALILVAMAAVLIVVSFRRFRTTLQ